MWYAAGPGPLGAFAAAETRRGERSLTGADVKGTTVLSLRTNEYPRIVRKEVLPHIREQRRSTDGRAWHGVAAVHDHAVVSGQEDGTVITARCKEQKKETMKERTKAEREREKTSVDVRKDQRASKRQRAPRETYEWEGFPDYGEPKCMETQHSYPNVSVLGPRVPARWC